MDVRLRELAARQRDVVAAWQLLRAGWSWTAIKHHAAHECWRPVHSGVYAMTQAPLTKEQVWTAATLTAPQSYLSHASAAVVYGLCKPPRVQTIVRPGNRGRHRVDGILVRYSQTLNGNVGTYDGIPITSPERTLIDMAAQTDPARPLREARRLKLTTPYVLAVSLEQHRGRRGTNKLKRLNDHYAGIPYSHCRSDAEAKALEILHDAGTPQPRVNERIHGEEADLSWPGLIIEIDGPQFHQIAAEDARKQTIWEEAGYTVRRVSSDDVYQRPEKLIRAARGAVVPAECAGSWP